MLRTDPAAEADLASRLIRQDGLAFFIADAEQEYGYTNGSQHSPERFDRSRQFVTAFRATQPNLPAALSSYCQPAMHDLDWAAWANAGFEFLPQAFVGSLGAAGTPATCVKGAAKYFPPAAVHPTIGLFAGPYGSPSPSQYGHLLAQAGTTGFSLYPAENAGPELQAYAQQIQTEHIAHTTA